MSDLLDRTVIEALIPHSGRMCLIDTVVQWGPNSIECQGVCDQATHPLLREGRLPSTSAIEYAGQAAAVHGALLDKAKEAKAGFLGKLTEISFSSNIIEKEEGPLNIVAHLVSRSEQGCIYKFEVTGAIHFVATGQFMIVFS